MDKTGSFIIKSTNYFFLVTVSWEQEENSYHISTVGIPSEISIENGKTINHSGMECVQITVSKKEDGSGYHTTAELDYLKSNAVCGLSPVFTERTDSGLRPLQKGGSVEMAQATMTFVYNHFGISEFSLLDASEFECPGLHFSVNLAIHSTLLHGKTWYQRKFNAKPSRPFDKHELEQTNALLDERFRKDEMDLLGPFDSNTEALIQKIEMEGLSWKMGFQVINSELGCQFFDDNVINTMAQKFLITDKDPWMINILDGPNVLLASEKLVVNHE